MNSRSSVLHIKIILRVALTITFFAVTLLPLASVRAASPVPNDLNPSSLLQEEPSQLELFYMQAPQLRVSERGIYVYLPPDYFTSDKSYPVLYLHDGQMVFSTNGAHDSRFNRVMNQMFADGETEGVIMVGVASSYNRWDEYSPWVNEHMDTWGTNSAQVEGGEGDAYLDFFINTLKPEIDSRYRTLPDREHTAIGGFSMGGLISLYAGLKYPNVYSKVMAMSTAVWFAEVDGAWLSNNRLINLISQSEPPQNVRFYLDIGTNEWADKLVYVRDGQGNQLTYPFVWKDGTEKVFAALRARGVPEENLKLVIEEGGEHEAVNWRRRFAEAMRFLFAEPVAIAPTPSAPEALPTATMVVPGTAEVGQSEEVAAATAAPEETEPTQVVLETDASAFEDSAAENGENYSHGILLTTGVLLILLSAMLFYWLVRGNSRNRSS